MKRYPAYIAALAAIFVLACADCVKDHRTDRTAERPDRVAESPYALYYLDGEEADGHADIVLSGFNDDGERMESRRLLGPGRNSLFNDLRDLDVSAKGTGLIFSAEREMQYGVFSFNPAGGQVERLFTGIAFSPRIGGANGTSAMLIEEGRRDSLLEAVPGGGKPRQIRLTAEAGAALDSLSYGGGNVALLSLVPDSRPHPDPRGHPVLLYLGSEMTVPTEVRRVEGTILDYALSPDGKLLVWIESNETGALLCRAVTDGSGIGDVRSYRLETGFFFSNLRVEPDGSAVWAVQHQAEPLSPIEPMEGGLLRIPLTAEAEPEKKYSFSNGHRSLFERPSHTSDSRFFSFSMVPHEEAFLEDPYGPQPWDILVFESASGEVSFSERTVLSGARRPCAVLRKVR